MPDLDVVKAPDNFVIPLSHGQKQLWFLQCLHPENPFYNYSESFIFKGNLNKDHLEKSIEHHAKMCVENSEDVFDALILAKMLGEEIDDRINRYAKCISKSTHNFVTWLKDDYRKKLNSYLRANFDEVYEDIHGHPPEE